MQFTLIVMSDFKRKSLVYSWNYINTGKFYPKYIPPPDVVQTTRNATRIKFFKCTYVHLRLSCFQASFHIEYSF